MSESESERERETDRQTDRQTKRDRGEGGGGREKAETEKRGGGWRHLDKRRNNREGIKNNTVTFKPCTTKTSHASN